MRPASLFAASSFVLNIGLLGYLAIVAAKDEGSRSDILGGANSSTTSPVSNDIASRDEHAAGADLSAAWCAINTGDFATRAQNLRRAGVPEYLVRAMITAEIDEQFRAREEALAPKRAAVPFWRIDTYKEPLPAKLARLDLKREKAKLRIALLGPDPDSDPHDPIPPEKRELARMIVEDYDTVINELKQPPWGMMLPSERVLLETVTADRQRELATLLTPGELAEYEFRASNEVQQIRQELAGFDSSEAEFRAICEIRKAYDPQLNRVNPPAFERRESEAQEAFIRRMQQQHEEREQSKRDMEAALQTALGEQRYLTYRCARDYEMQNLHALLERTGRPRDAVPKLFELRETIVQESARIGDDYTTSVEQRRARIRELATRMRTETPGILGAEAADAYLAAASDWLKQLENGLVITFDGNGRGARGISETPPPDRMRAR